MKADNGKVKQANAGGVQALSAGPADNLTRTWELAEAWGTAPKRAASPTPPAEQPIDAWEEQPEGTVIPVDPSEMQVAPKAAPGEPSDSQIIAAFRAYNEWPQATLSCGADAARWKRAIVAAQVSAHQQEAQEPDAATFALWYADHIGDENKPVREAAWETYQAFAGRTAHQPAPAPAPLSGDVLKKAARYDFFRDCDLDYMAEMYWPNGQVPTGDELDAVIDAALAAQEGK